MKYLKSNWVEDDNFGASDINEIAKTVNELIDRQDKIINDSSKSDESVYSSDKIVKTADEAMASVIKNGQNGLKTTYSSSMILDIISMNKFRAVAIDTLPRTGSKETVYLTPSGTRTELLLESPLEIYEEDGEIIIDTDSNDGSLPYLEEGVVFKYKETSEETKKNLMVTRINKNGLICTSDYDYVIDGKVYKLNSDALKTIEPIDGHCYRVKELYTLKAKNIGGISSLYEIFYENGLQIPVFEDVTRIAEPNIDDVRRVPGVISGHHAYCGRKSRGLYSLKDEDNIVYISYMDKSSEIPRNLKVGDILKATGENPMFEDWTPFFYAKSASNVHATVNHGEIIWDGEIDMEEWETGECYEIKGFYRFGGDKLEYNDSLGGDEGNMLVEFAIPIFEKKEDNNNYDYEVEILPFVIMSITGKVPTKESWVWINGEWEKIGGPLQNEKNNMSLLQ